MFIANWPPTNGGSGFRIHGFYASREALMGCEMHRVQPEIRFHDGRVQLFIELPLTRWQRLKEWPAVVLALIFALILKLFHL
jgi:hypothetical protein